MKAHFDNRRLLTALLVFVALAGCTRLKQCAYEGVGRDEWQKPDEVIRALAIRPGDRVADLGSGGGYFTFRLAKAVGRDGKVYAVDVDKGLNEALARRAKDEGYSNIEVILAKGDDPLLPAPVDLIFTSNTFHHLKNRARYFADVKKYLKPDGRIAIVEFNETGAGWLGSVGHYTPKDVILREMKEAGYAVKEDYGFLPRQHFLIFSVAK
ncbi:MAG TPA: methyltransferase domain-containing protein [Candidatus Binatia bacterium]|jgi:ubiquinone/menaquinone biosynthesis C-methylase UbiE